MREKKVYSLVGETTTGQRYAVVGNADRFLKHKHAYKAWQILRQFGCVVHPVAEDLQRLEGFKVYPQLAALKDKVDVVVPCLKGELIPDIINQAQECGAQFVWFQERNWTEEFQEQADNAGIQVLRGCVLKHKIHPKPFGYLHPCYWHGLKSPKAPKRR
ncbi:MAG: CoA-binding protein [Desulfitobacterium sp.]